MRMFQSRIYAATMSGGVVCRLTAFVCQHLSTPISQHQCDQLDERDGIDLRRDLRIVCGSSDIRRGLLDEASEALASEVSLC